MKEFILNQNELEYIFKLFPKNGIVLLRGDLASGKTTLVKSFAHSKGIDGITSPSFSLMQDYIMGDFRLFHYDIYQIGLKGLLQNGLFENLFEDGLHMIEWGDEELEKYLLNFGIHPMIIKIKTYQNKRKYQIYE